MRKVAVTYGDFNGIGFEIMVKALNKLDLPYEDIILVGSQKIFDYYSSRYNLRLKNDYKLVDVPIGYAGIDIGQENAVSGEHCFKCLETVCELVDDGRVRNVVTAPVSKHVLNMAGYNYSGQTEVLEKFLAKENQKPEMLFVAGNFRVMLLTRHIPVKDVSPALSKSMIIEKMNRLNHSLVKNFGIMKPKIGLLSFNPHAGEDGIIGTEEKEIILPAIRELRMSGMDISGPLVPDATFAQIGKSYSFGKIMPYDCYVAIYHDQGLIPMKLLAGDDAVNVTIGLSSIRTSPAHGTAYDIAGRGMARCDSMLSAVSLALKLAHKNIDYFR